nr:RHS repeat domain-containing protein [Thiobacillus denitrificans]
MGRTRVTDAESHTTRFEYDEMNRRTAVIDATGYRTETKYSLRGDVVAVSRPPVPSTCPQSVSGSRYTGFSCCLTAR